MIRQLRKIRKSLIESGSGKKYFFYATGEIFLVMVGILLALQLNNWNEKRKSANDETEYLNAMKDEFEENLVSLQENIRINEEVMEGIRNMLSFTGPDPIPMTLTEFRKLHSPIFKQIVNYEPNQAVLDDLISSGNLSKITSVELRRLISKEKAMLNNVNRQELSIREFRDEAIRIVNEIGPARSLLSASMGVAQSKFINTHENILTDPRFENFLSYCLIYSMRLGDIIYPIMQSDLNSILELIQMELNQE